MLQPEDPALKKITPDSSSAENGSLAQKKPDSGNANSKATPIPSHLIKNRKKARKRLVYILGIAVLAGLGVWYFYFRAEAQVLPFIRFATVDKGDIVKSVSATGTLQATTTVQVGSQVSGTIRALHADFNTRVTKGQLIAELDPTFYEASVKAAEANYARAKADFEIATRNEARNKELFDKNLISRSDYDQSETALTDAKATVQQLQAALDQAHVNLSYTKIHAPISGVVTQRSVDVGQTVAASLNAPVLFIIAEDLTEMEVQANVDEADIGQVRQGEDVSFTVDAFPGEKFHGIVKMVRLNPVITTNVVTYTVVISAKNKEEKLFPGMTATVTIVNSSVHDALRIPAAATRFVPPDQEGASASSPKLRTHDSTHAKRDTAGMAMRRKARDSMAVIYIRSGSPSKSDELPKMDPVKIKMGLTDGMFTEVLWSEKPLNPGDSIAVGMIAGSKSAGPANAPGTNPFGSPARPAGGAARR